MINPTALGSITSYLDRLKQGAGGGAGLADLAGGGGNRFASLMKDPMMQLGNVQSLLGMNENDSGMSPSDRAIMGSMNLMNTKALATLSKVMGDQQSPMSGMYRDLMQGMGGMGGAMGGGGPDIIAKAMEAARAAEALKGNSTAAPEASGGVRMPVNNTVMGTHESGAFRQVSGAGEAQGMKQYGAEAQQDMMRQTQLRQMRPAGTVPNSYAQALRNAHNMLSQQINNAATGNAAMGQSGNSQTAGAYASQPNGQPNGLSVGQLGGQPSLATSEAQPLNTAFTPPSRVSGPARMAARAYGAEAVSRAATTMTDRSPVQNALDDLRAQTQFSMPEMGAGQQTQSVSAGGMVQGNGVNTAATMPSGQSVAAQRVQGVSAPSTSGQSVAQMSGPASAHAAGQQSPAEAAKMRGYRPGSLAALFESGSRGGVSAIGYDRVGGTSYGKYQFSSRAGTMDGFVKFLDRAAPDLSQRLRGAGRANTGSRSGNMPSEWKSIARTNPARFEKLQDDFIHNSNYTPAYRAVTTAMGVQDLNPALQEVLFSTSVQHGPSGAVRIFAKAFDRSGGLQAGTEDDFIKNVYSVRAGQFGSSSAGVRRAVHGRLAQEMRAALSLLQESSLV